jgi:hypothetical protein
MKVPSQFQVLNIRFTSAYTRSEKHSIASYPSGKAKAKVKITPLKKFLSNPFDFDSITRLCVRWLVNKTTVLGRKRKRTATSKQTDKAENPISNDEVGGRGQASNMK